MAQKQLSDISEMIGKTVTSVGMEMATSLPPAITIQFSDDTEIRIEAVNIDNQIFLGTESQLPEMIELRRTMR